MSWLEDLEARLSGQLEDFLRSNPDQQELLAEQERLDHLERLRRRRLQLQETADRARADLLQLASEIRCWQERVQRARGAGAAELAARAEAHVGGLMEQGRQRWQALGELGQQFSAVEWELSQLGRRTVPGAAPQAATTEQTEAAAEPGNGSSGDLRDAWAAFEAQQDLEVLKQRLRH
ncbi:MAG: hercynine metabolism protein [Cyanobium sp.]